MRNKEVVNGVIHRAPLGLGHVCRDHVSCAGAANIIWGAGVLAEKEYLPEEGLLFSSLTFWGWVGIIWGALVLVGSLLLLTDAPSGREVGIVLAVISAVFWLFALPVLPIFALTAILVDSLIIYGLSGS